VSCTKAHLDLEDLEVYINDARRAVCDALCMAEPRRPSPFTRSGRRKFLRTDLLDALEALGCADGMLREVRQREYARERGEGAA
jgi:hypothetical protein